MQVFFSPTCLTGLVYRSSLQLGVDVSQVKVERNRFTKCSSNLTEDLPCRSTSINLAVSVHSVSELVAAESFIYVVIRLSRNWMSEIVS